MNQALGEQQLIAISFLSQQYRKITPAHVSFVIRTVSQSGLAEDFRRWQKSLVGVFRNTITHQKILDILFFCIIDASPA